MQTYFTGKYLLKCLSFKPHTRRIRSTLFVILKRKILIEMIHRFFPFFYGDATITFEGLLSYSIVANN